MKLSLTVFLLIQTICVTALAERVPSVIDAWSIMVLIEKDANDRPKLTVIKNEGEYSIQEKQLERFKVEFAKEVFQLNQEAIIYSATFKNGKKTSRTKKVTKEFAVNLRRLLHSFERVP